MIEITSGDIIQLDIDAIVNAAFAKKHYTHYEKTLYCLTRTLNNAPNTKPPAQWLYLYWKPRPSQR